MSGFFGIFRPQGGPVDLEAFEQMRKATEREGFDGLETHLEEKIAMGHLMLRVSPESKYDKQPLKSDCGNYLLVGHFRLDYRDELGDKLGLTQSELEITPDSKLVMLAYTKWKEDCVHHIEGDWAFALFDNKKNSLLLAKDQTGYSALFYVEHKSEIYFSSDIDAIVSLDKIECEIDLAQFCRMSLPGVGLEKGSTLFKKIYHLICAESIIIDSLLNFNRIIYWELLNFKKILYKDDQDYAENLRSIFSKAVSSRIRTSKKIGIFLSGGLDSSAVAYFASKSLLCENKKLHSYTSVPYYIDNISKQKLALADESPYVKKFIEENNNLISEFLNFPNSSIIDILGEKNKIDSFYPIVTKNTFWIHGIMKRAQKIEIRRMLNGQLGNFTISSAAPFIHADIFCKLGFKYLSKDYIIMKRNTSISFYLFVKERIIKPLYIQAKSFFYFLYLFSNAYYKSYSFLYTEIYKSFNVKKSKSLSEFIPGFYFISNSRNLRVAQLEKNITFSGMVWYKIGSEYEIENVDPTSDLRLINFSLSIPEVLYNKNGIYKYLYNKMMEGQLDDAILKNPNRLFQSYDIVLRVKHDSKISPNLERGIEDLEGSNLFDLVELQKFYKKITSSANPISHNYEISYFLQIFSLFCFYIKNKKTNLVKSRNII